MTATLKTSEKTKPKKTSGDQWPERKEYYTKSLAEYGEKKNKKLTLVVTETCSVTIRDAVATSLGENISLSEMMELISRGGLKLVRNS